MKSITLHVTGMTCGGCVKSVTRVLEELNGVEKAVVTLDDGKAQPPQVIPVTCNVIDFIFTP